MKRKGFTLIELLAVIVILAIIALIAVPMIMDVIEKARIGAAVDSAYGYLESLEQYVVLQDKNETISIEANGIYQVEKELSYSVDSVSGVYLNEILSYKGKAPEDGYVEIENAKVEYGELDISGYHVVCYSSTDCKIEERVSATDIAIVENEDETSHYMGLNDTLQLNVSMSPENATARIKWTSSDEGVAKVSSRGLVTPVAYGSTVITATVSNTIKADFALEVNEFYQDGKVYLYKRGKDNTALTGGYMERNQCQVVNANFTDQYIQFGYGFHSSCIGAELFTQKKIDLTGYSKLNLLYTASEQIDVVYNHINLCVLHNNDRYGTPSTASVSEYGLKSEETLLSLDISSINEEQYMSIIAGSLKPNIYEIWLEK